jgi:serine protease AprX
MAAALAAISLLAMPVPAGAQGSGRTVLLTLTEGASLTQLADTVGAVGGRVLATLELSDSLLVELPKGVGAPAGSAEIPDTPMKVNGTQLQEAASAPTYRGTIGVQDGSSYGNGVTVALVDTGVAPTAVGLDGVTHITVPGVDDVGDGLGHGTFLAGLIGGNGEFPGVAPGATLLDVKVANNDGSTSLSKVLAGLELVADNADVDVVNLSLSTDSPLPPSFDPLTRALERLWDRGVTVVAAAGNDGAAGEVSSPGNSPVLLTVGALDEAGTASRNDDAVASFSSRGTEYGAVKPDLIAPGVSLVSSTAPGSIAAGAAQWTSQDGYMPGSGTSMSAAVVAGAVAAVLEVNPKLSPNGVKRLLTRTTYSLKDPSGSGRGALDLGAAISAAPKAPARPKQTVPSGDQGGWGPNEDDAAAWGEFAEAWEAGDFDAVAAAWKKLSWQTQQWAARSWSFAVLMASMNLSEDDFKARSWSARSWSLDEWLARSWSARSWSARSWSFEEWLARSWSARSWSARSWSARSWSADEWLARSWSARSWSQTDWAARSWSARSWSARSWSARSWSDFSWEARSWSARSWSARSWSMTA